MGDLRIRIKPPINSGSNNQYHVVLRTRPGDVREQDDANPLLIDRTDPLK